MSLTDQLLVEIARPSSTRESIAAIYREGIVACRGGALDFVDWPIVNRALLKRYRPSGLHYIKTLAVETGGEPSTCGLADLLRMEA